MLHKQVRGTELKELPNWIKLVSHGSFMVFNCSGSSGNQTCRIWFPTRFGSVAFGDDDASGGLGCEDLVRLSVGIEEVCLGDLIVQWHRPDFIPIKYDKFDPGPCCVWSHSEEFSILPRL